MSVQKKKKKSYIATGAAARRLLQWVRESENVPEGDEVFYVAQCLAFLIHDTSAGSLSKALTLSRNRFAIRKLKAAISLLTSVFMRS